MIELTPKQRRFCEEYVLDLDPAAAYKRAGYKSKRRESARNAANRLLLNVVVFRYVQELQAARSHRTEIEADRVLREIAIVAFSRVTDYLSIEEEKIVLKSQESWGEKEGAIARLSEGKSGINLELHDKLLALKLLVEHLGLNSEFNRSVQGLRKYGLEVFRDNKGAWQIRDLNAAEPLN